MMILNSHNPTTRRPVTWTGVIVLILMAGLLAACKTGPAGGSNRLTATPAPSQTPGQAVASPQPTQAAGPLPTLQSPGEGWQVYHDAASGARFAHPAAWKETAPGHLTGPDGFAWLESRPNDGAAPGALCQSEANRGRPDRYGALPEIRDTVGGQAAGGGQTAVDPTAGGDAAPGCLILPSADQPAERQGEALYLLWPAGSPADGPLPPVLALHADRTHILAVAGSLRADPAGLPEPTAACSFQTDGLKQQAYVQNGLRVEEFPVAQGRGCSPLKEPEKFSEAVSTGAPAARAAQVANSQFSWARLARINAGLQPFGFQVQTYDDHLFRVVKNGKILRSNLFWLGQLTVNTAGDDFILPVVDSYNSTTYLVRPDGVHAQENWDLLLFDNIFPVKVGNDQISLTYNYQVYPRQPNNPALLEVKRNDQIIETYSISGASPARGPVHGLWAWDQHWVVELPGIIIQDGALLNDTLGYSELFTWRLINDKPFYFFRKDGQIGMTYAGQTLPVTYDQVIHEPQWTSALLVELKAYDGGLLCFARRGETWYYVVVSGG